jgi:uncharacterized protein (TIGR02145 family)
MIAGKNRYRIPKLILLVFLAISCKKEKDEVPTLTTNAISGITATTAISGGAVTSEGSGTIVSMGVCWSTGISPTISSNKTTDGAGPGSFTSNITGLVGSTVYYVRAYATNDAGTGYGMAMSFTTLSQAPTVSTLPATNSGLNSATLNSLVTTNNLGTTITFECGLTSSYGITITPPRNVIFSYYPTNFSASINGLTKGKIYHYRVKAENSAGITYGDDVTFNTLETGISSIIFNPVLIYGSVNDIDGNTYKTIEVGTQTWMAENLKTTKFNDGTTIQYMPGYVEWNTKTAGYSWFNEDIATYKDVYGALYNWFAVDGASNGGNNICPTGWHVPTDSEWKILTTYLGGELIAGGKLKEAGTTHWTTPNTGATNESGFTALPGGCNNGIGEYLNIGISGWWWSSTDTPYYIYTSWYRFMYNEYYSVIRADTDKLSGLNVRCIKDN